MAVFFKAILKDSFNQLLMVLNWGDREMHSLPPFHW